MDEGALEGILQRLDSIERKLYDQGERISQLERQRVEELMKARPYQWKPTPEEPKKVVPPMPPPIQKPIVPRMPMRPVDVVASAAPRTAEDAEYQIGAQILPKAGATIFILGLAYLVSLGLGRGLITPVMLWWGVNLLCAAFIGVGQWKREEREDFGQILTGIGSCGFYLNFAAGHVFQKLYEGETLVGLFVILSLINLGYAFWRSTKVFLAIGLLGGLSAALMPLDENNYAMNAILHFTILVPAALITAKNKWMDVSLWLWFLGSAALLPIAISAQAPDALRVGAILGGGLVGVAAYAWSFRRIDFDPEAWFGPLALFCNALIGFLCLRNPAGALTMLGFGAAVYGVAQLAKDERARRSLIAGAVAIPAILAPFGFWRAGDSGLGLAAWIFVGLAAAFAVGSRFGAASSLTRLAGIELALGIVVYLSQLADNGLPWQTEASFLLASLVSLAVVVWASVKAHGNAEGLVLTACILAVPMFGRMFQTALAEPSGSWVFGTMLGMLVLSAGLVALVYISKWESAATLLWAVFLLAFGLFGMAVFVNGLSFALEIFFLGAFAGVLASAAFASSTRTKLASVDAMAGAATALGGLLFCRLGFVLLTLPSVGLLPPTAVVVSLCAATLIALAAVWKYRLSMVALAAGGFWFAAAALYISALGVAALPFAQEILVVFSLFVSLMALTFATLRATGPQALGFVAGLSCLLGGTLLVRVAFRWLMLPPFETMEATAAVLPMAVLVLGGSFLALRTKLSSVAGVMAFFWLFGAVTYVQALMNGPVPWGQDLLMGLVLSGSLVALAVNSLGLANDRDPLIYTSLASGWLLISRIGYLLLTHQAIGMTVNAAVTFAWILTALVFMASGFAWKVPQMRYMSFVVIASTVAKVMLIDLASVDPGIRVAILLVLGLAMIGGGYAYIRSRDSVRREA